MTPLLGYVSRKVNAITGGAHSPEFSLSKVKDFVIARVVLVAAYTLQSTFTRH